jgi:hypothetical protein
MTVEELREKLYLALQSESHAMSRWEAAALLNTFRVAVDAEAFARGRAEGEEQVKGDIRKAADGWAERYEYAPMRGTCVVPESLLAPARAEGKAEGEERLQKYTEEYLKEGIKRCNAALAQGRVEGAEQERHKQKVEQEIKDVRAEIEAYDQFLVIIPKDLALTRMDYETKKKDAEERLAVLSPAPKESEK